MRQVASSWSLFTQLYFRFILGNFVIYCISQLYQTCYSFEKCIISVHIIMIFP